MPYSHYFIKLTPEEEKRLSDEIRLCRTTGEYRKCRRLQSIWLSAKRFTFDRIAKRLGQSYRTVQRWVSKYRKEGLKALDVKHDK